MLAVVFGGLEQTVGTGTLAKWGRDLSQTDFALGYRFSANALAKAQISYQRLSGSELPTGTLLRAQVTARI